MRKGYAAMAALLMMLLLTACQKEEKIGICLRNAEDGVSAVLAQRLESVFPGAQVEISHEDQSVQNQQILSFLEEKVALLIVEPVITDQMADVARLTRQRQIPVIYLNHAPEEQVLETWERSCCIGRDPEQIPMLQQQVLEALSPWADRDGDGSLGYSRIGGDAVHKPAKLWEEGWKAIEAEPPLGVENGDGSRESGRRIAARHLKTFGHRLDVIFCAGEELTLGTMDALAGSTEGPALIGTGGSREVLEGIRQGYITATVCMDPGATAKEVKQAAAALLENSPYPQRVLLPPAVVTEENIENPWEA